MGKTEKLKSLDNIRGIAILLVVLGHSIIIYSSSWNLYETSQSAPFLDILKSIINVIQMPLFFSLSGYLFHNSVSRKSFKNIITSRLFRLGVPFMVISYCWMLPIRLLVDYPGYKNCSVLNILFDKILLGKDNGHMWYLPTLAIIYVLSTSVIKLSNKIGKMSNHIYLYNLFGGIVLLVGDIFLNSPTYISRTMQYYVWFSFGAFICELYDNRAKIYQKLKSLKPVPIVIAVVGTAFSIYTGSRFLTVFSAAFGVLAFYLCMPNREIKFLSILSKNSYGIYLFHSPLVYITYTYFPNAPVPVVVFINFLVFGGIALGMTVLIRKTPLRMIIGEK